MNSFSTKFSIPIKDQVSSKEEFKLLYSKEYDLFKTDPIPKDLDSYYPTKEYISHNDKKRDLVSYLYRFVKKHSLSRKEKLCRKFLGIRGSCIDFGAGNGAFVSVLLKRGWNAYGVEPSSYAREIAKGENITLASSLNELPKSKVNMITLWHVLEHIPNYTTSMESFYSKLLPGGYLILALPNFKSFDASFYKSDWAAFDVPRHLWHFSKYSISRIAKENDFNLVKSKPMIFDAFYISYLSAKFQNKSVPLFRGIFIGMLSNISGIFTGEYSSMIYVLQKPKKSN